MAARKGVWQQGQNGHPKGRPSIKGKVETLARTCTMEALLNSAKKERPFVWRSR